MIVSVLRKYNKMKKIFLPLILLISINAYSQVGINNTTPSASLDVVSKGNTNATKALEINDNTNKELVSVSDTGVVRLENYKSYSFLGTDSNGNLKDGAALNIPSMAAIGTIIGDSSLENANVFYTIPFTINKINADNLTYNNGIFTVNKAGYYSITSYNYIVLTNGGGSAQSQIFKNTSVASLTLTGHVDGSTFVGHTTNYTGFYGVGDQIIIKADYTRTFRVSSGSLSIVYYGS